MFLRRTLSLVCFLLVALSLASQGYFAQSPGVREAYDLVSTLQFGEAERKIAEVKYDEPDNMLIYLVENYIDFFTIFLNERQGDYDRLAANKDKRVEMIRMGDKESPYYLFCLAEINLQWATARLKFGETYTPLREVYQAYKFLEKNEKKFPDFIENKKSLSIIHALSESIPGAVKTVFRVKGSIELGTEEIQEVVDHAKVSDFMFTEESYAIYAYILFFQNNKREEAYRLLFDADLNHKRSPLICFLKANIAQKNGYNEQAKRILEERPKGEKYMEFPYLDFMYGKYKLYSLDEDADHYMKRFIDRFEGRHFVKEAYQKLAWYALAQNEDIAGYKRYMELCQNAGHALVDEDKQALRESKDKRIPNATLLKARLLFDGGYYSQAYTLLIRKSYLFGAESPDRLEFHYRMGRVTHELANYPDAIEFYVMALNAGEDDDSFMSCNAALQIGLILEGQQKYTQSKRYYERCLDISPDEYENSLHQKAESGLERVKNLMRE